MVTEVIEVPGDLDGLTKPALAMSKPLPDEVALGDDGLLTSDEIMGLEMAADWTILSACNTAAAEGAGAEAASGLGRAFFYAGSRAIVVSNWPVHSDSTRLLMTRMMQSYGGDADRTKARALAGAMRYLIDEGVFNGAGGEPICSYALPLFWAPFVIIGDGR